MGECGLLDGLDPRLWCACLIEPRELQQDNWKLLPGPLPSGPGARAVIQGIPAKFPGSCHASLRPGGTPCTSSLLLRWIELKRVGLRLRLGLFSPHTFLGKENTLFSLFSMDAGDGL